MNILFVFIDMLRPNLLNTFNPTIRRFEIDTILSNIGGETYTHCYSPSPDTPRSIACLWSGLTPKNNGCDKRIKYPQFFLHQKTTLLSSLQDAGYSLNFFINPNKRAMGLLPAGFDSTGFHNTDQNLADFLKDCTFEENTFTFIDLSDMHWSQDDYTHNYYATKHGCKKVANALEIIDKTTGYKQFDAICVFSDHGFKLSDQMNEPKHFLLNEDRTRIFMQLKTSQNTERTFNNKLCSIYDVYPTIMDLIGQKCDQTDGISLLSEKEHDYIVVEDHFSFTPSVNQTIDGWAVITKKGTYYRTLSEHYTDITKGFDHEYYDKIIQEKSRYYEDYKKEDDILKFYRNYKTVKSFYNDGSNRFDTSKHSFRAFLYKIMAKWYYKNCQRLLFNNKS